MKKIIWTALILANPFFVKAQEVSPFDGRHWGIVLDHPGTSDVIVKEQIPFHTEGARTFHMNVYLPAGIQQDEKRPAVVFLNGIGDQPGQPGQQAAPQYTSWSRVLAANGFVAITMESETNNIQASFAAFFKFLADNGGQYNVDTNRIGVQAFSANCREVAKYLMDKQAFDGIKAAVFYYGEAPPGPYRSDLRVLFVVAELDVRGDNYIKLWTEALKTFAPWTITLGNGMPHAFDSFSDTETSRRLIMSTISFWEDQLGQVRKSTTPFSKERVIMASRYDRDQSRLLGLMRAWMNEHPDTKDALALSMYAIALLENRDYGEAEKYLKRSIAIKPENKGNYLNMALVSYALGKSKEAAASLAAYEKDSTPEGFTYWYIANRMIGIRKFSEAAVLYNHALTFPGQPPFVHYNLAVCYAMLGDRDKAFESLSNAITAKFGKKEGYEADVDLAGLKSDPRWRELMERMR